MLEQGDYVISVNSDSHTVLDQQTYTQDETIRYEGENKREGKILPEEDCVWLQ